MFQQTKEKEIKKYNNLLAKANKKKEKIESKEVKDKLDEYKLEKKKVLKNSRSKDIHIDFDFDLLNDSNTRKIYAMLPFLGKEKVTYIAKEKINGNPKFEKVKLAALLPFMNKDDIDEIFEIILKDEKYKDEIITFAPFVSKEALDKLCDEYCEGKYQYIDINRFYPFMSSSSISKLFDYFITKD